MMRSLYSAISGLKNHQTRMDVIGNNIANVNTVGYKTSRTVFQDIFSQTMSGGMANNINAGIGGTNPIQIGLGIRLSSIDVLHTRSAFQSTGVAFDMMINGDGFFVTGKINDAGIAYALDKIDNDEPYVIADKDYYDLLYTRAGNFKLDDEGYLTTSDGRYVLGYTADIIFTQGDPSADPSTPDLFWFDEDSIEPIDPSRLSRIRLSIDEFSYLLDDTGAVATPAAGTIFPGDLIGFSVGQDGSVSVLLNGEYQTVARLAVAMFSNDGGLMKQGNSFYAETKSSGSAVITAPLQSGSGEIMGGGLEMSNVDLSAEFTDMIVTQRGFQANARTITVSDTLLEELINLKRN